MYDTFVTECPHCGGQLYLYSCVIHCQHLEVLIEPDGFETVGDSTDEIVICDSCGTIMPLLYVS